MTPGWQVRVRGPRHGGTVRAENRVHGSDQKSCSPNRPTVMITDHVPAVRLPLDHTCDLMAAAIPPPGRMEDHGDLDPAPPARRTAILSEGLPGSPRQPTSAGSRPGSGCSSRKSTACQADRSRSSQGMRGRRGGARLRRRSGGSGQGMGRDRRSVAAEDPAAQHVRVDAELAARGARPGAPVPRHRLSPPAGTLADSIGRSGRASRARLARPVAPAARVTGHNAPRTGTSASVNRVEKERSSWPGHYGSILVCGLRRSCQQLRPAPEPFPAGGQVHRAAGVAVFCCCTRPLNYGLRISNLPV
jgi:hypothetical protein